MGDGGMVGGVDLDRVMAAAAQLAQLASDRPATSRARAGSGPKKRSRASAPEATFELLEGLGVAAHRPVEALQVAVDDEDEVVEVLPAGEGHRRPPPGGSRRAGPR